MQSVLLAQRMETAHLVLVTDTVAAIRNSNKLGAERAHDELSRLVLAVGLALDEVGNGGTIRKELFKFRRRWERSKFLDLLHAGLAVRNAHGPLLMRQGGKQSEKYGTP